MTITQQQYDTDEVRARNREIVRQYMECRGEDRLRRHLLFTEDGEGGLWTTETGEPIVIRGRDRLGEHAVWSLKCFPDWVWTDIQIFDTQDPDRFWVECDGVGQIRFPGYPDGLYRNHFLHAFEFEGGKIKRQREFMNPCRQFQALDIPVPRIERAGIPT
ncbi:PhzA/PhzB family protein [Actinomadura macrotermitis]|uniref:Phenazine biosynthesis protein PhzB1 n=1 Tax=Actinomadura macrotermitis TaxID=2585200 RepID=A0A7K0BZ41_9ACTN|nr:PhzA/PhzB family protein [Actinomadura macrotermitis]MQY06449.1 Phenazine biosynthesis protein PhzB1 [Actinomadura macrotermitis]